MSQRVWVVTGVSSGLGFAIASEVAKRGDKVIGTVRSLYKFRYDLHEIGVVPLVVDFTDTDARIAKAAKEALAIYGRVDVLVNNAGIITSHRPVEELNIKDIRSNLQVNFLGAIAFTQPFITHFRTRRAGHIINISSLSSIANGPAWLPYTASKAALDVFTESLTRELKPFNVRVVSVMPGYFFTNILRSSPDRRDDDDGKQGEDANISSTQSKIYTDRVTQGYDTVNELHRSHVANGQIGDPEKLAARIYELVTGTGLLKELVPGSGGKWEWNRMPLGPDCGNALKNRLEELKDNVDAFEEVWKSTDIEPERFKDIFPPRE
ncbi:short-chain dehydrogenases/reductases (SDR) family protein [Abortiporus biennis]